MSPMPGADSERLVPVVIRMDRELHAAVKAQAKADERSMAAAIRYALRRYVDA